HALFKILGRISRHHDRTLAARSQHLLSAPHRLSDTNIYVESCLGALAAIPKDELIEIPLAIARVFERAAALSGSTEDKYAQLVKVLRANSEALTQEVITGIRDYCFLIEHWPQLIAVAEKVGFQA